METAQKMIQAQFCQKRFDGSGTQRKVCVLRKDRYTKKMLFNEEPALFFF